MLANVADMAKTVQTLTGDVLETPLLKEWSIEDRHMINALNRSIAHIPYLFVVIVYVRDCVRRTEAGHAISST
jgi:hypothetical protein